MLTGLGKICTKCNLDLPVTSFYKTKKTKSGLASCCKTCHGLWAKENRERVNKTAQKYNASEERKAYKKQWAIDNRERLNALARAANYKKRWGKEGKPEPIGKVASRQKYYAKNAAKWANDRVVQKTVKMQATPVWADGKKISEIYWEAYKMRTIDKLNVHVDHIVPLRSKYVCGLHVHTNLRIVNAVENMKKGNREWPDMPDLERKRK